MSRINNLKRDKELLGSVFMGHEEENAHSEERCCYPTQFRAEHSFHDRTVFRKRKLSCLSLNN